MGSDADHERPDHGCDSTHEKKRNDRNERADRSRNRRGRGGGPRFTEVLLGTTEKFVAAQRFYEKNGFAEIEREELPVTFPLMAVDVKFYTYLL